MVDGCTGGARVPQSVCLHRKVRGVCEARGAMSRRSRSCRCTAAPRDRCRLASCPLGRLLIPFGEGMGTLVLAWVGRCARRVSPRDTLRHVLSEVKTSAFGRLIKARWNHQGSPYLVVVFDMFLTYGS
jgi:hypothetical protein